MVSPDALHQMILAGVEVNLPPSSSEKDRTVEAVWIKEAVSRHVRVRVRNGLVQGPLELADANVEQEFDVAGCIFKDRVDFSHATFKRDFFASDAAFLSWVTFESAVFEHKVTLQRVAFKGDVVIFANTHFLAEFDAEEATFGYKGGGTSIFTHARFEGSADFAMCVFKSDVHFITARFEGQGFFPGAKFKGTADFSRAHFSDITTFGGGPPPRFNSSFERSAFFIEAQFDSFAQFNGVSFQGDAYFTNARFGSRTEFRGVTFERANFIGSHFEGDAHFEESEFFAFTSFRNSAFHVVDFSAEEPGSRSQFRDDIDLLGCT